MKILQQQLAKLFHFDVTRTRDLHDVKLAFGLLMKASAAEGSIPHLDVSKQVGMLVTTLVVLYDLITISIRCLERF